jgi:hypothetical protein
MLAKLNALTLPVQFKYTPLTTRKRHNIMATAGGVVHQFAAPAHQLDGDSEIAFSIEAATGGEVSDLLAAYNLPNPTFVHTFLGTFGENYRVVFPNFEIEKTGYCLFRLTGRFVVLCVIVPPNFATTCPCP